MYNDIHFNFVHNGGQLKTTQMCSNHGFDIKWGYLHGILCGYEKRHCCSYLLIWEGVYNISSEKSRSQSYIHYDLLL